VACGLVQLGRLAAKPFYVKRGRDIFHYVLGQSSAFGWVPEYAQWHPMGEEHCETCCIKDMIYCAFELIDAGYPEYWDVVNRFVRNQLSEQQVKDGRFIGVDNTRPDTVDTTFRDLDRRIVGGWSGGGEPNSISLRRFRSVAGCCVGTAPQALERVWERIVESSGRRIAVQLPIDKDDARAAVSTGYPNEGWLQVKAKKAGDYAVRVLPFMERGLLVSLDGVRRPAWVQDGRLEFAGLRRGQTIRLEHDLRDETRAECARDREYQVTWRGSDVVDMTPHGEPLRLYQRRADLPKEIPPPPPRKEGVPSALDARPTEQKR
jgi:hypothetical protein